MTTPTTNRRRAAVMFIFITILLDVIAFGIVIPVLPHLIEQMLGGDMASAAWWVGVFGAVFALVQFISSPIQGALSDRYGRRPVILVSNLGLALDFLFFALAPTLGWLLFARVLLGITAASISTGNAYIADVTPPEKRAASYGILGAAFGAGFVIGPAMGGVLGEINIRLPFYVACGLALCNFLYGYFILPESLPPEKRTKLTAHSFNPFHQILRLRDHQEVFRLASIMTLSAFAHYVLPAVFVLYAAHRYGWGAGDVGWVLGGVGVASVIVQAGLVRRVVPKIGEQNALRLGLICGAAGFFWYGLAETGGMFLLGIAIMAFWGFVNPAAQALLTKNVSDTEQGRLQGAISSLSSLMGVVAPFLFASVFSWTIEEGSSGWPVGLSFWIASFLLLIGLILAVKPFTAIRTDHS